MIPSPRDNIFWIRIAKLLQHVQVFYNLILQRLTRLCKFLFFEISFFAWPILGSSHRIGASMIISVLACLSYQ